MKKVYLITLLVLTGVLFSTAVNAAVITNPIKANTMGELLSLIATGVAGIVGAFAVIMFLISGILFLTSAGDPGRISQAKSSLTYAVIGAVICAGAGAIVAIIKTITGI